MPLSTSIFIHAGAAFTRFHVKINNMATAAPLVVPALKKHTATVIWAHGLGDR